MSTSKSKIAPLFTWRSAIQSPGGPESPVTRHVLIAISLYMSEKGEGAFPSMERLAEDTALTLRTIKKHVPIAEKAGWIKVVKKAGRGQGWKRNDYKAVVPESYHQKIKELEEDAVQEVHQEGGEGDSPPSNNVVNDVHERGASECNNVVNEVHPNTPYNSSTNSKKRDARGTIKGILNGIPVPPQAKNLFDVDGFEETYLDYCQYLKEDYNRWPREIRVKKDYLKLMNLWQQNKLNNPVDVINQTIDATAKSFFPIRNFESKNNQRNGTSQHKTRGKQSSDFLNSLGGGSSSSFEGQGAAVSE